jgi:hypothetical protein
MATPVRVNGGALPVVTTGRALDMFTVSLTNVHVSYSAVDSLFEQLVRQLEIVGTVELLGTPASGAFRVAISGSAATAGDLQTLLDAAVAGTVTVADYTF